MPEVRPADVQEAFRGVKLDGVREGHDGIHSGVVITYVCEQWPDGFSTRSIERNLLYDLLR